MSTFAYEQDGDVRRTSRSFFRGDSTNFHPTDVSFDRDNAIAEYIIKGWTPETRFVTKTTPIVAFGSCFAANISNYLHKNGYNVLNRRENKAYVTQLGDGMVNTYAILQQFLWAWENKAPQVAVWHGKKAEDYDQDDAVRLETKAMFDEADLFVITLGLSELWYDEPTGEVFWRAVPKDHYQPERHKFRSATQAETLANLHRIYELIRRYRPAAHILFSVSPIPLTATFRPVSCITADAVSKATLRSALDEFLSAHGTADGVHYFPSYEAVKRVFRHQWLDDRRHVRSDVLDFNMKMFEHFYCNPGIPLEVVQTAFKRALEKDIEIGEQIRDQPTLTYEEKRKTRIAERKAARKIQHERRLQDASRSWVAEVVAGPTQGMRKGEQILFHLRRAGIVAAAVVIGLLALQGAVDWIGAAWALVR